MNLNWTGKDSESLKNARGLEEGLLADLDLGPDLAAAPGPEAGPDLAAVPGPEVGPERTPDPSPETVLNPGVDPNPPTGRTSPRKMVKRRSPNLGIEASRNHVTVLIPNQNLDRDHVQNLIKKVKMSSQFSKILRNSQKKTIHKSSFFERLEEIKRYTCASFA